MRIAQLTPYGASTWLGNSPSCAGSRSKLPLDLRRLLLEEELQEKSFFILKENPNAGDAHRANSFGVLVAIGVDAFATEVRSF